MIKMLLTSSLAVALLCGPALAQPAPAPAQPTPYKFKLAVTDGSDNRTFELVLLDDSCGSVQERQGDRVDEIKLCARATPAGARLEAHWKLRSKTVEHEVSYQTVVAKGKTVEVGRTSGARFSLTLI